MQNFGFRCVNFFWDFFNLVVPIIVLPDKYLQIFVFFFLRPVHELNLLEALFFVDVANMWDLFVLYGNEN